MPDLKALMGEKDEMCSVWSHTEWRTTQEWRAGRGGRPCSMQEENAQHLELVVDRSPLPRDVPAVEWKPPRDVDRGGQHWWESWTLTCRVPFHADPVGQTSVSSRASSPFSLVNRPVSRCQNVPVYCAFTVHSCTSRMCLFIMSVVL